MRFFRMIAFLHWARDIALGTLNGIAKFVLFLILLFALFAGIGMIQGDGLPANIVLSLDLRHQLPDSAPEVPFDLGDTQVTVMNTILALDDAERDNRVKGVFVRLGGADIDMAQAEEIDAALKKFRRSGKFVIAYAAGFEGSGLGDYLTATSANEVWMQPKSVFGAAGAGGGGIYFRGLFDKIQAVPQIAKRAEYKSAADQYMEHNMTPFDREQTQAMMQSWYDNAVASVSATRNIQKPALTAAFDASPQFAEDAKKAGLVDRLGYDDDAQGAALARAGDKAKIVRMTQYIRAQEQDAGVDQGAKVALIEGSGEIVDGTAGRGGVFGQDVVIAGDDMAQAIRSAAADSSVKAILLRVDSPGGSVGASDQILDAVKKAQAKGKPVVVSMGGLAASGGYYISLAANRIVAEPGTLTGSIGVLTGKVSIGKSLGLLGIGTDEVGVGKNALMNSSMQPYTPDQWAALNHQADVIYADFTQKVAAGRNLPLAKVQEIARGRVWTGADAQSRGLVDELGGFWTAVADAKKLGGLSPDSAITLKRYPRQKGFFDALDDLFGATSASAKAMQGVAAVLEARPVKAVLGALNEAPRSGVELRAPNLPVQ
jgi:protease-4